ncbi:hypothetical protein PPSAL_2060 [Ectopseudomonas oleovorans]|nr:hypothetical protein PPSAL_2060 [Pseudomonas oleovorans]
MTHRIIHFKQQALLDPETYQAMLADGVGHWERLAGEVVGIEDEKKPRVRCIEKPVQAQAVPL